MTDTLILACPHCHRKNRIPAARLADNGVCGLCKQPLFTGAPISITQTDFDAHISSDLPIVVDF